jgi:hypothetical protein
MTRKSPQRVLQVAYEPVRQAIPAHLHRFSPKKFTQLEGLPLWRADARNPTGRAHRLSRRGLQLDRRGVPDEPADVTLRYRVVRGWQVPSEQWLSGGLGVLPLAPLGSARQGAARGHRPDQGPARPGGIPSIQTSLEYKVRPTINP